MLRRLLPILCLVLSGFAAAQSAECRRTQALLAKLHPSPLRDAWGAILGGTVPQALAKRIAFVAEGTEQNYKKYVVEAMTIARTEAFRRAKLPKNNTQPSDEEMNKVFRKLALDIGDPVGIEQASTLPWFTTGELPVELDTRTYLHVDPKKLDAWVEEAVRRHYSAP